MKTNYDYLIVGQGIAGSMLAYHLMERGRSVLVIDEHDPNSSSRVAAGLVNPITGRFLLKTWLADDIFPYAKTVYQKLENELGSSFYHEKDILRLIKNEDVQKVWVKRTRDPKYDAYYEEVKEVPVSYSNAIDKVVIKQGAYLDLTTFLPLFANFLKEKNSLIEEHLNEEELNIEKEKVRWKGFSFEKVIFCRGEKDRFSKYFSWLPFRPVKGEILTLKNLQFQQKYTINSGFFLLPIGGGEFKLGATFDHDLSKREITEDAKQELLQKLAKHVDVDFNAIDQVWGIRPAVKDRRPLIGFHPEHPQIGVFNGMGTKGVTLAPYFANHFCEHFLVGKKLNQEVDIHRYWV